MRYGGKYPDVVLRPKLIRAAVKHGRRIFYRTDWMRADLSGIARVENGYAITFCFCVGERERFGVWTCLRPGREAVEFCPLTFMAIAAECPTLAPLIHLLLDVTVRDEYAPELPMPF